MLDDSEIRRKRAIRTAITKRWRAKNRETYRAYSRAYSKTPKARATRKAYCKKNRERINTAMREWRMANAELYRAKRRVLAAKERQRQRGREADDPAYAAKMKARRRFFRLQWEARNPEKVKARNAIRLRRKVSDATRHRERAECELRAAKSQDVVNQIAEMSGSVRAVELPVGPRYRPPCH